MAHARLRIRQAIAEAVKVMRHLNLPIVVLSFLVLIACSTKASRPAADSELFGKLVGKWHGCSTFIPDEPAAFVTDRSSDGRYVLETRGVNPDSRDADSIESGVWGVEGGRYFTQYQAALIDGEWKEDGPGWRIDYEIRKLTPDEFVYRSEEFETTFVVRRVSSDFVLTPETIRACAGAR